ncbi:MAG: hypothetical protein E6Q58_02950 [Niabella sp.]|nr:MAG: hypothetical protein E6Q58_02950 [Niabella sp.]
MNFVDVLGPLIAIVSFIKVKHKISPELMFVKLFCIVQLACNTVGIVLDILIIQNYWVYELNMLLSFGILLFLFGKYLLHLKNSIIYLLAFLVIISNTITHYFYGWAATFNSYGYALISIVIVLFCLYFFYYRLINTPEEVSVPDTSIFWSIVGIFTYYAGAFFIFISYKVLIATESSSLGILWRFHNILLLICCLYISYGVICKNYRTILS